MCCITTGHIHFKEIVLIYGNRLVCCIKKKRYSSCAVPAKYELYIMQLQHIYESSINPLILKKESISKKAELFLYLFEATPY